MRRWAVALLAGLLCLGVFAGCLNSENTYQDGTYFAEFKDYDNEGYKDTLQVTVENGMVTQMVFDAYNAEGAFKSNDEKMKTDMEAVQGTYPAKYSSDLVNQYLQQQDLDKVEAIAGATISTNNFKVLLRALEANMISGDTSTLVVDNPVTST